ALPVAVAQHHRLLLGRIRAVLAHEDDRPNRHLPAVHGVIPSSEVDPGAALTEISTCTYRAQRRSPDRVTRRRLVDAVRTTQITRTYRSAGYTWSPTTSIGTPSGRSYSARSAGLGIRAATRSPRRRRTSCGSTCSRTRVR